MFIDEIITGYVKDMSEKEAVQDIVLNALNSKKKLTDEQKEKVIIEVS